MQHAFRATVSGLSQFKCAANFDVIFFPCYCLKPLALFIIRGLWSEQRGNNVSRRHTNSDGPLTALRRSFLSPPFVSTSTLPLSFHFSFPPVFSLKRCLSPRLFPLALDALNLSVTSFFLSLLPVRLYQPPLSHHTYVWASLNYSSINWNLISWCLTQGDRYNEDTDNESCCLLITLMPREM